MILVTGATGNVGSEIARQLIAKGIPFRIYVRDADKAASLIGSDGYETALGDFSDEAAFATALTGIDAVYMVTNQSDAFKADLQRMIRQHHKAVDPRLFDLSAEGDPDSDIFFVRRTGELEHIVREADLNWTFLRPDWFMQNFAGFVAMGMVAFPEGPGKTSFVDVRDVAEIALKALTEPGHGHRTYRLTGPDAMTFAGAAARISSVLGRDIPFVGITPEDMRDALIAQGAEDWYAEMNAEMTFAVRMGMSFSPSNDIEFLLGRKPRSIETYTADHMQAWATQ
ncbi:MAG: SDR family oxidoreductase [Pseudomonadota bacterium]